MARKTDNPRYPLSLALGRASAVALLRLLCRHDGTLSLRQLSRAAGLNHQGCAETLARLEQLHLVRREYNDRCVFFSLNTRNAILSELLLPLFEREARLVEEIERKIHGEFSTSCLKIVISGAATGSGTVSLLVRPGEAAQVERKAKELAAEFEDNYGFDVDIRVFNLDQAPIELL